MITGIPSIDNELDEVTKQIIQSLEKEEKEKNELLTKLKKVNRKERQFIIFKTFFNSISDRKKEELSDLIRRHPFMIDKLMWIVDEAIAAREYSNYAICNRDIRCKDIMTMYNSLLKDMSKLSQELGVNNSLELSILFSYLLWNGYLSKTKKHTYGEEEKNEILGLLFVEVVNGCGVCRNYSEMLKDFLNYKGYNSVILANCLDNIKVDYQMNIRNRINTIPNIHNEVFFQKKEANHVFNLIEDNGIYIYDTTNLLLYSFEKQNSSLLINGKGKNKIYPYQSYDFCYSRKDEQLLDKIFMCETTMISPYNKTDFISISEITLEMIKNNLSLLEDFYDEIKSRLISISEEKNKALIRTR